MIQTNVTLHPGEIINRELEARKIAKKDFAKLLGIAQSQLSELLHGKRHVSTDLAIKLEEQLDIQAEFWLNVQNQYNLDIIHLGKTH